MAFTIHIPSSAIANVETENSRIKAAIDVLRILELFIILSIESLRYCKYNVIIYNFEDCNLILGVNTLKYHINNMVRKPHFILLLVAFFMVFSIRLNAAVDEYSISGTVLDAVTGEPLQGAALQIGANWSISDENGAYCIRKMSAGSYVLKVELLGYSTLELPIEVKDKDITALVIKIQESSLALEGVTVTAQKPKDGIGTSHNIGRDAMNHLQVSNMADMTSLLPGGKTVNPDLTAEQKITIRGGGTDAGNASFSTAIEVDGVRMGNNAGFAEPVGVDTRSIAVDNIESVEVISGVPSAEYGDLGSGMVKVHTKTGRTPVNVNFSINPRTYQVSASKGIDLSRKNGTLNVSAEWTKATKKLDSPYESYNRKGLSLKYANTFADKFRFEIGATGNLGGMNSEDDPDAFSGEYTKARDNNFRGNFSLQWLINKNWITSLKLEGSVNFTDNRQKYHKYNTYASNQPAVHSELEGYYLADRLPYTFYSDQITDSKELDYAASIKYVWDKRWNGYKSNLKAGVQWKANGNIGDGEYYEDPSLAANGYRPRPYSDYPYMHNVAGYIEEDFTFPCGLELMAGLRMENVYVKGSDYSPVHSFSPRFNAKWQINDKLSVRAGWGVSEKLPSYYILYPKQEYRDIQTFGFSHGSSSSYVYYTQPYSILYNDNLKWQRTENSEIGMDFSWGDFNFSLVGFYNITRNPYRISSIYSPFSYDIYMVPSDYIMPDNPQIMVDNQTGMVYLRSAVDQVWREMELKVTDRTFVKNSEPDNGSPVKRAGAELTVDFPQIKALRTSFRLDAAYTYTNYTDRNLAFYYNNGWSHTSLPNRSYQYVGIYANGGNATTTVAGKKSHTLDANLTSITHITEARLIVTCRLELSILKRNRNIPAGGTDRLLPVAIMDLDGNVSQFTASMADDPEYKNLIIYPGNDYAFDLDGYGAYASANISITKEIGKHISLSFFANNFTNSRTSVTSKATGVAAIFTPDFYYGLTCRIKL